jgi:5-methylcytosine-specific restriction protein A
MTKRIRGRKLQYIRMLVMMQSPWCAKCKRRAWTELDHIKPLSAGGDYSPENLQGLCAECHRKKTAADFNYKVPMRVGPDGYPVKR